jgi:hypothetical protein
MRRGLTAACGAATPDGEGTTATAASEGACATSGAGLKWFFAALLVLALAPDLARGANVELGPDSNIRITATGALGNCREVLTDLLARHLLGATGRKELTGPGPTVTFLIESGAEWWHQIPRDRIKDIGDLDAFEIEVRAQPEAQVRISGATAMAAGFGITTFLEKRLGVMWAFPGDLGICFPPEHSFTLAEGRERFTPAFVSRLATGFVYPDPELRKKGVRSGLFHENRIYFSAWDYYKAMRLHFLASPSHNMINIFPVSLKEKPENADLFPMKDGKRWLPPNPPADRTKPDPGVWAAWHPCYTNPRVIEIAAVRAAQAFEKKEYCFSLGINDGRRVQCKCPECERVGWPRSYYDFVTAVAERVKDYYPPHMIGVLAYGDVRIPPADVRLPENVLVLVAGGGPEQLERWAKCCRTVGVYEYCYGQGFWYPNLPLALLRTNADYYREHNIRLYRGELPPVWAFDAPLMHLRTRQLWEPQLDLDAELRRFCSAAFAEGGGPMEELYRHWARKREADARPGALGGIALGKWPNDPWRDPVVQFGGCTAGDFAVTLDCLARARVAVRAAAARKRLEMVETFFTDSCTLFEMYDLGVRLMAGVKPEDLAPALRRVEALPRERLLTLERMRERPEWFAGTSDSVDEKLEPSWEDRGRMVLPKLLRNAALAALLDLRRADPARAAALPLPEALRRYDAPHAVKPQKVHLRATHPWYPEGTWTPMKVEEKEGVLTFGTVIDTSRMPDRPDWSGRRKPQWLATIMIGVPLDGGSVLRIECNGRGARGTLRLSANLGYNNAVRGEAAILHRFGDTPEDLHRVTAIPPVPFTRELADDLEAAPGAKGNVELFATWAPEADDAAFSGTCAVARIEFTPRPSGAVDSPPFRR